MYKRKIVGDQNIDVVQSKTQCIIGTPKVRITFSRAKKKKPSSIHFSQILFHYSTHKFCRDLMHIKSNERKLER